MMSFDDLKDMDGDSALGMLDAMGGANVAMASMEGDQLAGMFAAMEGDQLASLGEAGLIDAFGTIGVDNMTAMGGENIAEMFGALGEVGLSQLDAADLQDAAVAMGGANMLELGPDAAASMLETKGVSRATETYNGDQLGLSLIHN